LIKTLLNDENGLKEYLESLGEGRKLSKEIADEIKKRRGLIFLAEHLDRFE
jgi:hypothetical protein